MGVAVLQSNVIYRNRRQAGIRPPLGQCIQEACMDHHAENEAQMGEMARLRHVVVASAVKTIYLP